MERKRQEEQDGSSHWHSRQHEHGHRCHQVLHHEKVCGQHMRDREEYSRAKEEIGMLQQRGHMPARGHEQLNEIGRPARHCLQQRLAQR